MSFYIPRFDSPITRRGALASSLGMPLVGAASVASMGPNVALADGSLDFESPEDNLKAMIKMSSSLQDREVTYGYYSGHVFGVVGDDYPKALFRVEGFGLGWTERQDDGSYKQAWKEIGLYRDLVTGKVLDRWHNPYLDEVVEPLHIQNERVNSVLATSFAKMFKIPPDSGIDVEFPHYTQPTDNTLPYLLPWQIVGDMASVWMDFRGTLPNPLDPNVWVRESTGERIRIAEFFQYTSKLADLKNEDMPNVPHTGSWVRIAAWLPWMLMGRHDGHLFYRASTKKLSGLHELPADTLSYVEKNLLTFLEPPTEWKLPNESSWEVYKKTREPAGF